MKIDFHNLIGKNISKNLIQPRRSQIYVGYQCHQKCAFCYYKKHYDEPMFSRDFVIRQIDLELAYGITDFEITGGEPSECEDLEFYCQYIKEKLPSAKIAIITNGGIWKESDKLWNLIDEVLISYHSPRDNSLVDRTIFPLGSTYEKVKKTVDKARAFNVLIRTNTVIGTFNIDVLYVIVDDLISFNPEIVNFLPINLFDDANDVDNLIDYNKFRPIIKKQIDKLEANLPNALKCIRFMPYCQMEGYEKYIVDSWQHMYDWFDWNPELCGYYLIEYLNKFKTNEEILQYLGKFGSRSLERSYDCIEHHYEKNESCLKCKYYLICDGVEKTPTHHILRDIVPSKGKMIKDPMFYLSTSIQNKYEEIYGHH